VLASLGVASAQAALWACGAPATQVRRRATDVNPEIRTWLRDAVATLRGAGFSAVHVLATSRLRTTAAVDVLGAGVARGRCDGLVITVRERDGAVREQVGNDLSRAGIAAAVKVLAPSGRAASVDFGRAPAPFATPSPDPDLLSDGQILARASTLAMRDRELSSRIVYSAAVIDIDDSRVWSVAPGRDLQQRIVRVRRSITRVAWNGTRPIVSEAARAWAGGIDDQDLDDSELVAAREGALALMTPRAFEDREYPFALDPAVAASVVDAAIQALLTSTAARRPEVAQRLAIGARIAPPLVTLVDDPAAPGAYGGFAFDDAGEPARAVTLIDGGTIAARLARPRRPGNVGRVEPMPSHVRLAPGTIDQDALLDEGFTLEGPLAAIVDPAADRVVIAAARVRERSGGKRTGRMFADIELVGELSKLLGSLTALSKQTKTIGIRDDIAGQPRWRSIEVPWLRGRGMLRARRGPA
jgi:predicted Zn-dependent protease